MKIAVGSDHAGFKLKQRIIAYLKKKRISCRDFGTYSAESCDYPDFAFPIARGVARGKYDRGILICGSGVGVTITANRVRGVRAVNAYSVYIARQSRAHGDTNVLCLGGRTIEPRRALRLLAVWLKTPFAGDERHRRRLRKIDRA